MIKIDDMNKKAILKVSVSDSNASSTEEYEESENEVELASDDAEADAESDASDDNDAEADAESDASDDNEAASNDESSESSGENGEGEGTLITNEGWADSVAKILGSTKPKSKKTLVLSRAKKHADIVQTVKEQKPAFEVIGEIKEEKPEVKKEVDAPAEPPPKKKKFEKASIKVKPNILEKDRERLLSKIATKGVVQLFNAVRNQQKTLQKQVDRSDLTEGKKEKIMKKFDKRTFLDTLMGGTKSVVVDEETKKYKDEVKDEEKPKWNALRDDFMMGAKMKDWDKESVDE